MKGGGPGGGATGGKRRWRGLAIAVLGLIIILSMLVPLGFLLGLHNGIILSAPTAGTGFVLLSRDVLPRSLTWNSILLHSYSIRFPFLLSFPQFRS